ncbi:MAG: HAD family phosphatase [Bacteroidetes bacterium]|nr:MAG: HAD family phosphatase [Bacteroidota bacterium]
MNFKAVIFDLDGTLIDSMGIWLSVDKEFLTKRNIPHPKKLFNDMNTGNSFMEVAEYFKKKFKLTESIEEIMNQWIQMAVARYKKNTKLKPGAFKLLQYLKEHQIKLGIGTSNSRYLAEIVLSSNNVLEYFDTIVDGQDVMKGKPFPDIFLKVASNLNIVPEYCIVIQDILDGIKAAKNAGMTAFAIYDKFAKSEEKEIQQMADFYAKNFYEIIEKIKQLN